MRRSDPDLDPDLERFVERATAQIAVPPRPAQRARRLALLPLLGSAAVLVLVVATGLGVGRALNDARAVAATQAPATIRPLASTTPLPAGSADPTAPAPCGAYAAPDPSVPAEVQHLKTSATVVAVTSPCTVRVTIAGGIGSLLPFTGRTVTLRATSVTTFVSAADGDLQAIGRLLKPNDTVTLSFDSRAFPDGTYPLNFLNR